MEELFDVDGLRDGYGGVVLREVCGTLLFGKVFSAWMYLFCDVRCEVTNSRWNLWWLSWLPSTYFVLNTVILAYSVANHTRHVYENGLLVGSPGTWVCAAQICLSLLAHNLL